MAHSTLLSSKNQIVIPKDAREALGIKSGDKLLLVVRAGKLIVLEKPASYRAAIKGLAKNTPYPAGYLADERKSWD